MNTNEAQATTAHTIAHQTYLDGPDNLHWDTRPDGTEVLTIGDRKLMIVDEPEADETLWGWTWSTYERDAAADVWETMSTDAGPVDQASSVRQALLDWARA